MADALDAPIGVFDSGIGGLTVLRALLTELPHERFIYLGDTARLPYGTKTAETVVRYSLQAANALLASGVKCIVVACNTASSVGLPSLKAHAGDIPVIGVIEPGANAAAAASRSGDIAVIGTERTVREGAYQRAILRARATARIRSAAAPLFVALAEEGLVSGAIATSVAHHYLDPLFGAAVQPDTLVLGCTHFPLLAATIQDVVGRTVTIVDSAATTARAAREELAQRGLARATGAGAVRFRATDGAERFARVGSSFMGRPISAGEVELVDL